MLKKWSVFSNLPSRVIFIELARVFMFHTSEMRHEVISGKEYSEHRFSLVFAVHCGIVQGSNVPVHWKDFIHD